MTAPNAGIQAAYFDQRINGDTVFVLPGHHHVLQHENIAISTLLGSCVSACIKDRTANLGGLNHFLLPEKKSHGDAGQMARYGVQAMEILVNDLLKRGAKKTDLEAKVFGGANVIATSSATTVGHQNGQFVKEYLKSESIHISAEDLGGTRARRIYFYPATGKVSVLLVNAVENVSLQESELELRRNAHKLQKSGSVELF